MEPLFLAAIHGCNAGLALIGKWRYCLTNGKLSKAIQAARQVYSVAREQNDVALLTGAYNALACTTYCLGDFEKALPPPATIEQHLAKP
jgi:hypothetical protein